MPIIEMPDGTELEFPEGMDRGKMREAIRSKYSSGNETGGDELIATAGPGAPDAIPAESPPTKRQLLDAGSKESQRQSKYYTGKANALDFAERSLDVPGAFKSLINLPNRLTGQPDYPALVSPEQVQKVGEFLNPLAPGALPQDEVTQGLLKGGAEVASGLTSPDVAAAALLAKKYPVPVSTLFAGETLGAIPEATRSLLESKTPGEAAERAVPTAANLLLTKLLANHLVGKGPVIPKPGPPTDIPPEAAPVEAAPESPAPVTTATLDRLEAEAKVPETKPLTDIEIAYRSILEKQGKPAADAYAERMKKVGEWHPSANLGIEPPQAPETPALAIFPQAEAKGLDRPDLISPTQGSLAVAENRPERMLGSGEVTTTSSGRKTSPFPKVNVLTNQGAGRTLTAVNVWLRQNAIDEAKSRGDKWNQRIFESEDPKNMPPASKDAMNEYLFGVQPEVPKPLLKSVKSEAKSGEPLTLESEQPLSPAKASQEFDRLIVEHGLQLDWIDKPDALFAEIGKAQDTASIKAKLAKGKALQAARRKAAGDLGLKPDDVDTVTGRAKALDVLKKHIEERNAPDTLPETENADASFLPEEKPAQVIPKLRPGEKGTGDLLQGEDAPFNLAGETAVDTERVAREKTDAAKKAAESKAAQEKQQPGLTGTDAPKPKWTSATDENALGGQMLMGIPDPIKTFKAAVALTKAGVKALAPHARAAADSVRQIGDEIIRLHGMTDYRRSVLGWSAKLQRSFGEAAEAQADIQKRVPDAVRRDGITNWIQADGDAATLTARRDATADPKLRAGYDAALALTPDEIAVANDVRSAYNALGARGQHYDVLNAFKDNYVTQIWNLAKGPVGGARTLKQRFRFARASTFPTFFDGEQAGYVPKTKDISKLLPVYLHEMNAVIAARQLVQDLSKGNASDGRPLVSPRGVGVPVDGSEGKATLIMPKNAKADFSDYKTMENQPALTGWRWAAKDSAGNPIFLKADLALHPEAYNRIKAVLGKSAVREWYSTPTTALASVPKGIVKLIDRANSETKRTMLGMLSTFHQVQEGFHGIGHRVSPVSNIPKIDLVRDAGQMDAAKHGLMLLPDRASEGQFMEGLRTSGLVSKIPVIGPLTDIYSNYLFHQYIPGVKYKTYQAIFDRNQKVFRAELASGEYKLEDIKVLSAEQANAAYGHLNYADLGRNPTIQHLMQLGLLAPDFLEARARFAGQALRGATGAKVGREQVIALATLAVAQAALAWLGAKTTDGEWDPKHPFELRHGTRKYTMRSVPEDIAGLISNTRVFVHSRLSPLIGKGALQYGSGVDWRGQKVNAWETTKELAAQPLPLSVRAMPGLRHLTGSDRPGSVTPLEQLAGVLGLRISRANPQEKLNDLHADFLKNNPSPKVKADYEANQAATFPVSKYKTLDSALSDKNDKDAKEAIAELRKTQEDSAIVKRFRKFGNGTVYHESRALETKFVTGLTPEQRKLYDAAKLERQEAYRRFLTLWAQRGARPAKL